MFSTRLSAYLKLWHSILSQDCGLHGVHSRTSPLLCLFFVVVIHFAWMLSLHLEVCSRPIVTLIDRASWRHRASGVKDREGKTSPGIQSIDSYSLAFAMFSTYTTSSFFHENYSFVSEQFLVSIKYRGKIYAQYLRDQPGRRTLVNLALKRSLQYSILLLLWQWSSKLGPLGSHLPKLSPTNLKSSPPSSPCALQRNRLWLL
ncbi:hypothetical protein VNO77_22879 [Canavalia gladiata]|uniref:Uncharacterized protein n=1 Tax=Canavalia gladiata TaxID=3824 RepID=A0AAN9Q8E0_CANGL